MGRPTPRAIRVARAPMARNATIWGALSLDMRLDTPRTIFKGASFLPAYFPYLPISSSFAQLASDFADGHLPDFAPIARTQICTPYISTGIVEYTPFKTCLNSVMCQTRSRLTIVSSFFMVRKQSIPGREVCNLNYNFGVRIQNWKVIKQTI